MYVCTSFRRYSDEDLSKLGMTSPSAVALSPMHAAGSSLHAVSTTAPRHLNSMFAHNSMATAESADMTSVLEGMKNSREVLQKQMDDVLELKVHTGLWLYTLLTYFL